MNYSNPSIVSKWENKFPNKEQPKKRKASQKKSVNIEKEKPHSPTLRLIQKTPTIFQLERKDNPVDFERMAFAVKACSKNKPGLNVLHVEQTKTGSRLVACDGIRLHVAEVSQNIKTGDYKVFMAKDVIGLAVSDMNFRYPNWMDVLPSKTTKRGFIDLENAGFVSDRDKTAKLTLAFNSFTRQTGETVNLRYLEDLLKKRWMVYSQSEKGKAVILRENDHEDKVFALIMPMQQPEQDTAVAA
jgi:hypothetical protein